MKRHNWLALVAISLPHLVCSAQTVNWVQEGSPDARCCTAMAYSKASHGVMMFSGSNAVADTWVWNGGWHNTFPPTSPPARGLGGLAADGTGNLVLFGGVTSSGTFLNDTWTWDGKSWTQQFPGQSPSPRSQMAMAYDPTNASVVLFGGCNVYAGPCTLDDTWVWNGLAKTWAPLNPAVHPSGRRTVMTYDVASKTMLLFGGDNAEGVQYTDSWVWSGANWQQIFPENTPPARTSPNMVYDEALGAIVLFGGYAGTWQDSLNDTWLWNGTTWKRWNPAAVPPDRYDFGMAYDPIRAAILMFGGYSSGPVRGDTWVLALVP